MAKKASAENKTADVTLGQVVMIFSKSNHQGCALVGAKLVSIEGVKFIDGTQVTGRQGHRMEQKRTLIPLEHVASIVEFATEEDLFSEPQPRHIRPPDEDKQYTPLTSHGAQPQGQQQPRQQFSGGRGGRHRRHNRGQRSDGFRGGNDFNRGNRGNQGSD